jgi:hypothetical protein
MLHLGSKETLLCGPQTNHQTGGHEANSPVYHQAVENECKDIMKEMATIQMKEETISSLKAIDVGALTTLQTFTRTSRRMMVVHLDQFTSY